MGITTNIKKHLGSNANKISYFVKWYVDSDKSKESYDKDCKYNTTITYEHAMKEWLIREDVQDAIKSYMQSQANIKMIQMFESMYKKAINKGDVKCAEWCQKFYKSDFFKSDENEIDNYLDGIDIPELGDNNG